MSDRAEIAEWSPARGLVALAWVGCAAALAWCGWLVVTAADPAGQLLSGVAAVGLGAAAVYGTRVRPRLRVDPAGLTVGGLAGPRRVPWADVGAVRVLRVRRFGRDSALLEVDTVADGVERLVVFGRLDLDADPEEVATVLAARRPR